MLRLSVLEWLKYLAFEWFILCNCRKGDYYRYLAEFKTGDDRKEVADQSMKAYQV